MNDKDKLAYLMSKLGTDPTKIKAKNDDGLAERIKLQKIVFFAKRIGVDFKYDYSMFVHGPYSRDLARDYYSLNIEPSKLNKSCEEIDVKINLLSKLYKHDSLWMETAATILAIKDANTKGDRSTIVTHTEMVKSLILSENNKEWDYVYKVFDDLAEMDLIS